jgi:hypothetical protein
MSFIRKEEFGIIARKHVTVNATLRWIVLSSDTRDHEVTAGLKYCMKLESGCHHFKTTNF